MSLWYIFLVCWCLTRRLRLTRRRSTSAILRGRGPRLQHVKERSLKRLQTVQDLWLQEDSIHVWTDWSIGSQRNAHNYSTAEGECSLQENIGRLNTWDTVSLPANASLPSNSSVLALKASGYGVALTFTKVYSAPSASKWPCLCY